MAKNCFAYFKSLFMINTDVAESVFDNMFDGDDSDNLWFNKSFTDNNRDKFIHIFHEYMHFLQDLTTYSDLWHTSIRINQVHQFIDKIKNTPSKTFDKPYKIENENKWDKVVFYQLGDDSEFDDYWEIQNITIEAESIDKETDCKYFGNGIERVALHIKCEEDDSEPMEFDFGSHIIRESMAYMMELCCFDQTQEPPKFPYKVVEDYVLKEYPILIDRTDKYLYLVALCDYSLQFSLPGKVFYHIVDDLKKGVFQINAPEDIYKYKKNQLFRYLDTPCGPVKQSFTWMDNFNNQSQRTKKDLQTIWDAQSHSQYNKYIEIVYGLAQCFRNKNPHLFLDIAREGNPFTGNLFRNIIGNLGTPTLFINDFKDNILNNKVLFPSGIDDEWFASYLLTWRVVYRTIFEEECNCPLLRLCKKENVVKTDDNCVSSPWKRTEHCNFKALWNYWGLSGITPKNN